MSTYRNWAMQSDLGSMLDQHPGWRGPSELGLSGQTAASGAGGQGALERELEPDPEVRLRTRTSLALWSTAFFTDLFNQFSPVGMVMSDRAFTLVIAGVFAAIVITAISYPRLKGRWFLAVEQSMVGFAFALIVLQCSDTGGAESPYAIWWLFTAFYAAHFFPPRRVAVNLAVTTALILAPAIYDDTVVDAGTVTMSALLITLVWTLGTTISGGRELERGAERAARYSALADPLTGVANMRAIDLIVERATRGGQPQFGLAFVDMNGLKGANATYGYRVGDDMLVRLAGILRHVSDPGSQVARVRGEEFVVYLPEAGVAELAAWRTRFEAAMDEHNSWIRNRMPQISATVATVSCPIDGSRLTQLFAAGSRRLASERRSRLRPSHEVDVSTVPGADQLLGRLSDEPRARLGGLVGATQRLSVRWAFGAALFAGYAAADWRQIPYPGALLAVAAFCLALSGAYAAQGASRNRLLARFSDAASNLLIFPLFWSTGGWQTPLLLTVFFPIVFYGQFLRGRETYIRAATLIACFTIAYWASGPLGLAEWPVSQAGQTFYLTITAALLVLTVILQSSHKLAADALRRVRDAATHDPLTGLRNAYALREDLQAMIDVAADAPSTDAPLGASGPMPHPALMIADIDDFRGVINRFGHQRADELLVAVSARLGTALDGTAAAYHIERDQFAVLFKTESDERAAEVAQRVEAAILDDPSREPRLVEPVGLSFGTAVWRPDSTVESIVDEASAALAAKRSGGGDEPRGGAVLL